MSVEKYMVILFMIVLTLSMVGTVGEDTEKTNITVISKSMDIDKDSNQEMALIYIETNKMGHVNYIERYYSKNDTGVLSLDSAVMYYNDTLSNNTLALRIERPLDKHGNSYRLIKAVIYVNNNKEFDTWFVFDDEKEESPGFDIAMSIVSTTFIIYLLKKRKIRI